jgi:hypothetical protein
MKRLLLFLLLATLLIAPAVTPAAAQMSEVFMGNSPAVQIGGGLSVTTNPAVSVTGTSAVLRGTSSSGGTLGEPVKVWFEYGDGPIMGNSTPPQSYSLPPSSFSATISGLTPGLTYSFQAVIMPDLLGSTPLYGGVLSFTTTAAAPTQVATYPVSSVGPSSATLNGNLVSLGSQSSSSVGFEWGTSTSYGNTTPLQNRSSAGGFSFNLTNLGPGVYHYRAFATVYGGSAQGVYGGDEVFQITAPSVSVLTQSPSVITSTTANLTGTLYNMGGYAGVQGWFEWGTRSFTNSTSPQTLTQGGDFGTTLTGLQASSTYIYRAAARGNVAGAGTSYGETRTFSTPAQAALAVQTRNPTSVGSASANLNGTLLSLGSAGLVQVAFEWGTTPGYGNTTNLQNLGGPADFSATLSGLAASTTYYFRAVVRTPDSTSYGGNQSFTTSALPPANPAVETASANELKSTTATLNGNLRSVGGNGPVRTWFEYGRDTGYGTSTQPSNLNGPGPFSAAVSGLQTNTVYYYRAVAQAVSGGPLSYGLGMNFTTPAQSTPEPPKPSGTAPSVSAGGATNLTGTTATLAGNLTSLGNAGSVQVYFEWGSTINYGNITPMQVRTAAGPFTAGIAGLTPGTTYHYRVVAVAQGGDGKPVYSSDMAFATAPKSGC